MPNVLITCGHLIRHRASHEASFTEKGVTPIFADLVGQQFSAEEMVGLIAGIDVIIAGDDFIDRKVLEVGKADRLKAVIKWGIGVDSIDLAAARDIGIPVYNTPGVFSNEVADLALGHVILLARRLHDLHNGVREGRWIKVEGTTLAGHTAGVIGLGGIGRAITTRCKAFGMKVIGYDSAAMPADLLAASGVEAQLDFDEVVSRADFLIIACALTPETRHLINARAFGLMKKGARIVNVARGPIVDEAALVEALRSKHLAGAGLDVYEEEPLPASSPLREFDNVVFGTHNGSNTLQGVQRVNELTVGLSLDLLGITGQPPRISPLVPV